MLVKRLVGFGLLVGLKVIDDIVALHFQKELTFLDVVAEFGVDADNSTGGERDHGDRPFHVGSDGTGGVDSGFSSRSPAVDQLKAIGLLDFDDVQIGVLLDDLNGRRRSGRFIDFCFRIAATGI